MPVVSVDFDGVIHSYTSGWLGAAKIPDPPVPGSIDALFRLLDAGFRVAIFSSRSKNLLGRWAMQKWLQRAIVEHWLKGGSLPSGVEAECWSDAAGICRKFSWPWFKPNAIMTIDDRALTFDGDWSNPAYQPDAILAFKPWNKKLTVAAMCALALLAGCNSIPGIGAPASSPFSAAADKFLADYAAYHRLEMGKMAIDQAPVVIPMPTPVVVKPNPPTAPPVVVSPGPGIPSTFPQSPPVTPFLRSRHGTGAWPSFEQLAAESRSDFWTEHRPSFRLVAGPEGVAADPLVP